MSCVLYVKVQAASTLPDDMIETFWYTCQKSTRAARLALKKEVNHFPKSSARGPTICSPICVRCRDIPKMPAANSHAGEWRYLEGSAHVWKEDLRTLQNVGSTCPNRGSKVYDPTFSTNPLVTHRMLPPDEELGLSDGDDSHILAGLHFY
jgi:hypothetical protein